MESEQTASGILQINEKGFGFLRQPESNYMPSPKDVFVPRNLIQQFKLREGVQISGTTRPSEWRGRPRADQLASVELINEIDPDPYTCATEFTKLTSVDPTGRPVVGSISVDVELVVTPWQLSPDSSSESRRKGLLRRTAGLRQ